MLHFRQATVRVNGLEYSLAPGRINSFESFYVDFQQDENDDKSEWSLFLHPKEDLTLTSVEVQFSLPSLADGSPVTRMLANGFQSWSESRLLPVNGKTPRPKWLAGQAARHLGDEHIAGIPRGSGVLHSWTYTWLTGDSAQPKQVLLLASTNESTGFTLFLYDATTQVLTVRKDLTNNGLQVSHSFPALAFSAYTGKEQEVFDRHFGSKKTEPLPGLVWSNEPVFFSQVNEAQLLQQVVSVAESGLPFEYFQVGDGWQTAVGDWLSVQPDLPAGMGGLVQKIREKGLKPGLWLAPFVVAAHSETARKHPEWLLKKENGQPLRVGNNPQWGGWYHALNFYQPGVRDYLSGVFHVLTAKWGFELLQLDALFAVCLAPPPGKTRGQVAHEALEFLRHQLGPRTQLVAGGVPLGAALGLADGVQISSPQQQQWQPRWLASWKSSREMSGAWSALRSTLGRWQLGGRAWFNAPAPFTLHTTPRGLSANQQNTLLTVNALLGQLLLTSDDVAAYSPEQRSELEAALALRGSHILGVNEIQPDVYHLDFQQNNLSGSAFCNLSDRPVTLLWKQQYLTLEAFETLTFF